MGAYSDRVIADGAMHYWRFTETSGPVLDLKGTAHGTITAGIVERGVPGAIADGDPALRLAYALGTGGYVSLPSLTLPAVCSVEAWVKAVVTASYQFVWTNRSAGVSGNAWFDLDGNGRPEFGANAGGGGVFAPARVDDDQWHHLVGTSSGTALEMFVDGAVKATRGLSLPLTTGDAAIGWDAFNGSATLTIDDLAIYPHALSPAQIAAHYALATATGAAMRQNISLGMFKKLRQTA